MDVNGQKWIKKAHNFHYCQSGQNCLKTANKVVYTASSVASFWAGAVILMMPPALIQPFRTDLANFCTSGTDRQTNCCCILLHICSIIAQLQRTGQIWIFIRARELEEFRPTPKLNYGVRILKMPTPTLNFGVGI